MALTKPSTKPRWASDPTTPAFVAEPSETKKSEGWIVEKPPLNYFNWLLKGAFDWFKYLDPFTYKIQNDAATKGQAIIVGGGIWKFVLSTEVLSWSGTLRVAVPGVSETVINEIATSSLTSFTDGKTAYIDYNRPVFFKGNTTNASPNVTGVDYLESIDVGMRVIGAGIPLNTTVLSISVDEEAGTRTVVLSDNATVTASNVTMSAFGTGSISVTSVNSVNFVPAPNRIILARRIGDVVYLGEGPHPKALNNLELHKLHQTRDGYDAIVGNASNPKATHATITAALAALPAAGAAKILVTESLSLSAAVVIDKDDITIEFAPGVSYTRGSGTNALDVTGDRVTIIGGRFVDYTSSNVAIKFSSGGDFGMVTRCRFVNVGTNTGIDNVTGTTEIFGNIFE